MQTYPMGVVEHQETARKFLREADALFRLGDDLQGAEKTWGAATHAVIAVCQQRGWRHHSHPAMDDAVQHLAYEIRDAGNPDGANLLRYGFVIASQYHVHFYHRDMDIEGGNGRYFDTAKEAVEQFVARMLAISESLDSQ